MRIDSLTGLRIIAAAAVFLSHVATSAHIPERLGTFMHAGYNGVTLFFTLSGFVLAWNYAERLVPLTPAGTWSYMVARVARIYPLYLFALALAIVPYALAGGVQPNLWEHIFALQAWNPSVDAASTYNGPGWSIGVEFYLYACFPFIVLLFTRAKRTALLVSLVVTIAVVFAITGWFVVSGAAALPPSDPSSAHRWLYRTPLLRLGDFTVGVIAALLIRRAGRPPVWVAYAAQALGVLGFVLLMSDWRVLNTAWSWDVIYLTPTFLLIWGLAVGPTSPLSKVLSTRPMIAAGEASFAFYLLHAPILGMLDLGVASSFPQWALIALTEFAIVMLAALGAHATIERPAQRWLRRVLDRPRAHKIETLTPSPSEHPATAGS